MKEKEIYVFETTGGYYLRSSHFQLCNKVFEPCEVFKVGFIIATPSELMWSNRDLYSGLLGCSVTVCPLLRAAFHLKPLVLGEVGQN